MYGYWILKKEECKSKKETVKTNSKLTCQSLVVIVTIVVRPTVHCLMPSPKAVVWVCKADEPNIAPQVDTIRSNKASSPKGDEKGQNTYTILKLIFLL